MGLMLMLMLHKPPLDEIADGRVADVRHDIQQSKS